MNKYLKYIPESDCELRESLIEYNRIVLSRVFDHNGAFICNVKSTVPKLYYYVRKLSLQCLLVRDYLS